MTVPQSNRRRRRLLFGLLLGLLPLCLAATTSAASAAPRGRPDVPPVLTWSTVSPPVAPPPLAFASAVYDSDSKTVVLFGGVQPDGVLSNDTWVWNGSTWTDYPGSEVQAPPAREMASMAFDPKLHQLILFGGEGTGSQLLSDTWAWNGASWYDETGRSGGTEPSARANAAMAYDGAGDLLLFGGIGNPVASDPPNATGAPGPTASSVAPAPAPASSVASSVASTTSPGAPAPSSSGSAGSAGSAGSSGSPGTAGGASGTSAPGRTKAGAAGSHRPTRSTAVPVTSASVPGSTLAPSPGAGIAAVAAGSTSMLGDTWLWTANGWTAASGPGPTARSGAALAFDPAASVTVLFGGESAAAHPGSATLESDTWLWNGQAWHPLALAARPPGRAGAAMAADASIGGLVLFGGSGGSGDLSDTWLWNGRTWAPAHTTGSLAPRMGAATAFDAATTKVLVFGGRGPGGVTLDDTVMLSETAPVTLSGGTASASPPSSSPAQTAGSTTQPAGNAAKTGLVTPSSAASRSRGSGLSSAHSSLSPLHPLHRGDLVTVTGAGFATGARVTIWFHSQPVDVGKAFANSLGQFTATVAVPNSATDGVHRFEASGLGRSGPLSELIATVKIVGVPDQAPTVEQRVVLTGVALLIPGITWMALVVTGRVRRRRAPVH